jgi:hypothetical protein
LNHHRRTLSASRVRHPSAELPRVGLCCMSKTRNCTTGFLLILASACSADNQESGIQGSYIIRSGIVAIDTDAAAKKNLGFFEQDGKKHNGVVAVRPGLMVAVGDQPRVEVGNPPNPLTVFDANQDGRIDASDPVWDVMHLAVDYNGDGTIGSGEYALIGECGVNAIRLDPDTGEIWSLHKDGKTEAVQIPE